MAYSIMVVDDDQAICASLKDDLKSEGYDVWVALAGKEALDLLGYRVPDIVILDVALGDMTGLEVCRFIRTRFGEKVGVIMMSGVRKEDADWVAGFDYGANFYFEKPCKPAVLRSQVRRLLSQLGKINGSIIEPGWIVVDEHLRVNFDLYKVMVDEKPVVLPLLELKLLKCLMDNAGKPVARDNLLELVWGYEACGAINDNTLNTAISRLRSAIEGDPINHPYITTYRSVGYQFRDF